MNLCVYGDVRGRVCLRQVIHNMPISRCYCDCACLQLNIRATCLKHCDRLWYICPNRLQQVTIDPKSFNIREPIKILTDIRYRKITHLVDYVDTTFSGFILMHDGALLHIHHDYIRNIYKNVCDNYYKREKIKCYKDYEQYTYAPYVEMLRNDTASYLHSIPRDICDEITKFLRLSQALM